MEPMMEHAGDYVFLGRPLSQLMNHKPKRWIFSR